MEYSIHECVRTIVPRWPPPSTLEDIPRPVIGELYYEPRRFTSSRGLQFVWPKDKHQSSGGRLKDVLSGKGPDIFVNRRGDSGPHRSTWSGWKKYGLTSNNNKHGIPNEPALSIEGYHLGGKVSAMPLLKSADRRSKEGQVYDFYRRNYTSRDNALWSDAHHSRRDPKVISCTRDAVGFKVNHEDFPDVWTRSGADDKFGGWNEENGREIRPRSLQGSSLTDDDQW